MLGDMHSSRLLGLPARMISMLPICPRRRRMIRTSNDERLSMPDRQAIIV
jgi:hypothetical protein